MKKNKKALILSLKILMGLLLLSYLNYEASQTRQMFIANRLYSVLSMDLMEDLAVDDIKNFLPRNSKVFFEHDDNGTVRTFYQNGNWKPPLISGTFFNNNNNNNEINSAVVGVYALTDEMEIVINNQVFQIIGVLGAGYPSVLDRLVLLNNIPIDIPIYNTIIDVQNINTRHLVHDRFDVENRHISESALDFLDNHLLTEVIRQNIILITIVLAIIIGYIFYDCFDERNKVLQLNGYSNLMVFLKCCFELIVLYGIAFLIILVLDFSLGNFTVSLHIYIYFMGLMLILISFASVNIIKKIYNVIGGAG